MCGILQARVRVCFTPCFMNKTDDSFLKGRGVKKWLSVIAQDSRNSSMAGVLEWRAETTPNKPCLLFEDKSKWRI